MKNRKLTWVVLAFLINIIAFPAYAQWNGWEFPSTSSYTASSGDNGKGIGSDNAPGATLTLNLPCPAVVGAGWQLAFSAATGRGFFVNAPNCSGQTYILAGQKTLTTLTVPSNTNYEYGAVSSDGTNFRLTTLTKVSQAQNGLIATNFGQWTYLYSLGFASTVADNGTVLSSKFTGGANTVTLPSTGLIPNGWSLSLYPDGGNSITLQTNATSGGSIITQTGASVTSYLLGLQNVLTTISFDGAAFRVTTASTNSSGIAIEEFGADGTAANDDTAFTNAISYVQAQTGYTGCILLGARTYNISQSITINGPAPVCIKGQGQGISIINASNNSNYNLISYGNTAATANQTEGGGVYNLSLITNDTATAGYAISAIHTANFTVRDIIIISFCGIEDEQSNNDLYDNVWGYTRGTNCQAFFAHVTQATQDAGGRSDQLTINNFHINSLFYGNDCFVWQGMVNTINMYNDTFLQCNHGFWINASQNTESLFPQFGFIYNLQVEGAQTAGVEIDGGRKFYFTDSDIYDFYGETGPGGNQGNADIAAFLVEPDKTESVTSDIGWKGGEMGGTAAQVVVLNAYGVKFSDTDFRGASLSSPEAYPSVELKYTTSANNGSGDYLFSGVNFCSIWGDTVQASYGLIRDANVGALQLVNVDFHWCVNGSIQDNNVGQFKFSGGIDPSNIPLPVSSNTFVSNTPPTLSSCGAGAAVAGNNLSGTIEPGSGSPTSCTLTFANTNAANNNGVGCISSIMFQQPSTSAFYGSSATANGFTVSLQSGGALPSAIPYMVKQCYGD